MPMISKITGLPNNTTTFLLEEFSRHKKFLSLNLFRRCSCGCARIARSRACITDYMAFGLPNCYRNRPFHCLDSSDYWFKQRNSDYADAYILGYPDRNF